MNRCRPLASAAEEGAAAAEAAVIMPVLLLAMIGVFEFGRAFWTYNTMQLAIEDAGRYAMVYNHGSPAACGAQQQASNCPSLSNTSLANCAAWHAKQVLSAYQLPDISVSVQEDASSSPATATVCASFSFNFNAPRLLPYGPLELTSRVTVPLL